jgi:murein DD-endopeptidase MepM/ murein hydrolase activator NlpD
MSDMNDEQIGLPAHKKPNIKHWLLTLLFFSLAIFVVGENSSEFHASVIPTNQPAAYNGTALPVLRTPKWTSLGTDLYKASYDQIPNDKLMPTPVYDANVLKTPAEQLGWKSDSDLAIRNAKITFSVAYLGNYKLDGVENAGSHPAVDIKVPDNTPVYAIGNGVVTKVADQTTGFGKHIVIKHENFPSLTDANAKTTIYSSYNHLNELDVSEGDVVVKGQFIGKSGHTGTATTPHVHFQIDNSDAPWHPYWPFTYAESNAAGYSFFDAINNGLGADKAKATTINPMVYVQKYLNTTSTQVVTNAVNTPAITATPAVPTASVTTPVAVTPAAAVTQQVQTTVPTPVVPTVTEGSTASALRIESDGAYVIDAPETITIKAVDSKGDLVKAYKPKDAVYLETLLGGADLPQKVASTEFADGAADVTITPKGHTKLQLKASDGIISGESSILSTQLFNDIDESSENYKAVEFLKKNGVIIGYTDGTFKPTNAVTRVEALKFILKGANARIITDAKLPFKDTSPGEWFIDYVATGYNKGIVAGYEDKTFKPNNTVNRVEFLKMLIASMDLSINDEVTSDPYLDVPKDSWFAPYVKFAKDKNLVESRSSHFRPDEGMTREEVAEVIYRIVILKLSGKDAYDPAVFVSSAAINSYFN